MPTDSLTDVELLKLFESRRGHIAQLLELSKRQSTIIDSGNYSELLNLLNEKQRIIAHLETSTRQMAGLQENWHAVRGQAEAGLRQQCEQTLQECETILATLMEMEQDCTTTLTARRNETQKQLSDISSGGEVHNAYRDPLAVDTHRYLDIGQ